ncbi:unnamed protein product, partial [Rotaria socialis]
MGVSGPKLRKHLVVTNEYLIKL